MRRLNLNIIGACIAFGGVAAFFGVALAQDSNAPNGGRLTESDSAIVEADTGIRSRTAQPAPISGIITTTSSTEGNRLRQPNAVSGPSPVSQAIR